MVALTQDRNTAEMIGEDRTGTLGLNQSIFAGSLLMRNATGDLIKGATALSCFGAGRAEERMASTTAGVTVIQYKVAPHGLQDHQEPNLHGNGPDHHANG